VADVPGHGGAELRNGLLVAVWGPDGQVRAVDTPLAPLAAAAADDDVLPATGPATVGTVGPVPRWLTDELRVVARWLDRHATTVRLTTATTGPASPWPRPPTFKAAGADTAAAVAA